MKSRIARRFNNRGARLPGEALRRTGRAVGDTARVEVGEGRVTLEKARRVSGRYHLGDLVVRMPKEHHPQEESWGAPVGLEEW